MRGSEGRYVTLQSSDLQFDIVLWYSTYSDTYLMDMRNIVYPHYLYAV